VIAKFYCLLGSFLLGVALSGLVSYSAYTFPLLRKWAFCLLLIITISFVIAGIVDEQLALWLGVSYRAYIALMIGLFVTFLIGGLIQWQ
jgi:hypothetical protein